MACFVPFTFFGYFFVIQGKNSLHSTAMEIIFNEAEHEEV